MLPEVRLLRYLQEPQSFMRGEDVLDWLGEWGEGFLSMEIAWRMEASVPGWMGRAQRPDVMGSLHASTTDQIVDGILLVGRSSPGPSNCSSM